jgi:hypothetical protein
MPGFSRLLLLTLFSLITDVVFVVDCGRVKENRKDELNEMPTLVETWVSRASAKVSIVSEGELHVAVVCTF